MLDEFLRVLVVEARFHTEVADELLRGAKTALAAADAQFDVISVPGALEIPPVIAMAEEDGHRPTGVRYDGFVALGCVVRNEVSQLDIVAGPCVQGLMDLAVGRRMAIGSAILAVDSLAQALALAQLEGPDRGGGAARSCVAVIGARRRLLGQAR